MQPELPIAIVSAMHQELRALMPLLRDPLSVELAGRTFHQGTIHGHPVVLVLSGIGKVAASITTVLLLHEFHVRKLVFTGVAGGLARGVRVGDVVVAEQLLQHDMDASPLFPRFEIPLTGRSRFATHSRLADELSAAAGRCLDHADAYVGSQHLLDFAIDTPLLHRGLIASGDRFVSSEAESDALRVALPDALAVEMEGAAVAQACADFERPFVVLRTISDRADDTAHVDFGRFIDEVASVYTRVIVEDWLRHTVRA